MSKIVDSSGGSQPWHTSRYESLGDALDAIDMGIIVDVIHLRELAAKSIGPFETELTFETEDGKPLTIDFPCEKNPGHKSFIPVSQFKPENIPEQHRTKRFYETILSWANLVVRVVVKRVSRNRPEVYSDTKVTFPDSDKKLKGSIRKIRYGSGYVVSGFGPNQPYRGQFCPCHLCRDSGQRREFWSLNIATVTHVIYDSSEARDSVFEFFYDSEDKKGVDFMYGTDSFEQVGKNTEKICIVRCVTHDRNFVKRLLNVLTHCQSMAISRDEVYFENDPVLLISHPHGKCKCITMGHITDFTVPLSNDFPANRPITFTRTAECRLPLLPWRSHKPDFNENMRSGQAIQSPGGPDDTTVEEKSTSSNKNEKGWSPLPTPIKFPTDTELYMEANGFFVINTGKNQNVLSPGMYKRESENANSSLVLAESETRGNCERGVDGILEYFYEGCNFRCINVDNDAVFTTEDIHFGNPAPPRNMFLGGLQKSSNDSEQNLAVKLDVNNSLIMYETLSKHSNPSKTLEVSDAVSEDDYRPKNSATDRGFERNRSGELQNDVSGHSNLRCTVTHDAYADNRDQRLPEEDEKKLRKDIHLLEKIENTPREETSLSEEGKAEDHMESKENDAEKKNELSVGCNLPESKHSEEINKNSETGKSEIEDEDGGKHLSDNDHLVDKETTQAGVSLGSPENNACSGATPDLSIPEMLQILVDKGINLFPESDGDSASGVDMINELMNALYHGDGMPLISVLNKIHEDVATRNMKPITLDPGSQFNLPEGMTFTLPENAKFALRFHDLTSSWFSFPPGTIFHKPEGHQLDIPCDAEFSFKCQSVVQGFLKYKLDSCPGSSGGLVVLGEGKWNSGHIAHSGQFDNQTRENRSSLRHWLIYIS